LNSSLDQPSGEVWPWSRMVKIYSRSAFVGAEFFQIFAFTAIILAPRMLQRQSRAQKTLMIV